MTKDEFISKYHTQKVLRFEPPTWEEFLESSGQHTRCHWVYVGFYNFINVIMFDDCFLIGGDTEAKEICFSNLDNREEMYYKALDIAKKWFLG